MVRGGGVGRRQGRRPLFSSERRELPYGNATASSGPRRPLAGIISGAGAPIPPTPGTNWLKQCLLNRTKKQCPSARRLVLNPPTSGLSSGTARVQGRCRRAKTPWQWRTDRARGRQPIVPNVAFWTPRNQLQTLPLPAVLQCQLPNCLLRLAGGFRLAQLGSKDGAAGLKHHGSEGRIGPAAGSPERQTLLSERLETSCTASFQIACCVLQVAFVWHSLGPRTVSQH